MDQDTMHRLADHTLQAWSRQDIDDVLACYTKDLTYLDPNTHGLVQGAEAMRRYLTKLYEQWDMNWYLKEARLFEDGNGCAALWRATLRRKTGDREVEAHGMDLIIVEGELIKRNEVYFDRALLAPLM